MATIPGSIPYTGFIAPTDSADTFPVTKPEFGLGSLRTVADITERNAITSQRREQGMLVYVVSESAYYKLEGGITNSDWQPFLQGVHLISATYTQLAALVSANGLIQGQHYLLTDFQTIYDQHATGDLKTAITEPLILTAANDSEFHVEVISTVFPTDKIKYDFTIDETFTSNSPCKGRIIERIDDQNNRTDYDHRVVLFPRWDNGSGSFIVTTDNTNTMQEFLTFGADCRSNYIGDVWLFRANVSQEFPNFVMGENCFSNKVGNICINNTWGDGNEQNTWLHQNRDNVWGAVNRHNLWGVANDDNTWGDSNDDNTWDNNNKQNTWGTGNEQNIWNTGNINNTWGDDNTDNTWGNANNGNNWGNSNSSNKWLTLNSTNTWGDSNTNNTWGDFNSNNTWGTGSTNNVWGDFNNNNVWFDHNNDNTWGNTNNNNEIGNDNSNNVFGNSNSGNIWGDDNTDNTWGNRNNNNTWGNQNEQNKWSNGNMFNTWGDGANRNHQTNIVLNLDLTSATHIYNPYDCEIFVASNSTVYLKYFNGTAYVFVGPTT